MCVFKKIPGSLTKANFSGGWWCHKLQGARMPRAVYLNTMSASQHTD